jgi:LuxR family transcriptional regulator, maltose regulon positive regulatory protein
VTGSATERLSAAAVEPGVVGMDLVPPPPPQTLVPRPRLYDLLEQGVEGPLTLVSAHAGAGKTVLLSSWLAQRGATDNVAWLSLRPDQSEAEFWAGLLEAGHRTADAEPLAALAAPKGQASKVFLNALLNALAQLDEPLIVIIDDLHQAPSHVVSTALRHILWGRVPQLRLVLSTRSDPVLPLHLLRLRGDLTELRAADLAFTREEARRLFDPEVVDLSEERMDLVVERTEGWAAGLALVRVAIRGGRGADRLVEDFAGDERPVADYLAEEVLNTLTPDVQAFLLRTSIVDEVTAELADVLTAGSDSERVLHQLVSENIFVEELPGRRPGYRYHHLFLELLRAELNRQLPREIPRLHERAARWLGANGRPRDALQHAIAGGRWRLAAELLLEHWFTFLMRGDLENVLAILNQVPAKALRSAPMLRVFAALASLGHGDIRRGELLMAGVEDEVGPLSPELHTRFRGMVTFTVGIDAALRGRFDEAKEQLHLFLELIGGELYLTPDEEARRAVGLAQLGESEFWLDEPEAAREHLEESLELARSHDAQVAELAALSLLALLDLREGFVRRAARFAQLGVELSEARGWAANLQNAWCHAVLATGELMWGDLDTAAGHLELGRAAARAAGDLGSRVLFVALDGQIALMQGGSSIEAALLRLRGVHRDLDTSDAHGLNALARSIEARLLAEAGDRKQAYAVIERSLDREGPSGDLVLALARIQLADGRTAEAVQTLERFERGFDRSSEVDRFVLEAVAQNTLGGADAAAAPLERALELAEPETCIRPFIEASAALRDPLSQLIRRGTSRRWLASEILAIFDGRRQMDGVPHAELLEPLSEREREVLRYLPTMLSNAEIAGELFVSVNTVKSHVKSIYRKLGAVRRQDAVRRARQLRLI